MKKIHELKLSSKYFNDVRTMDKPFEVRYEKDRSFKVGDELLLKEWVVNPNTDKNKLEEYYTGEILHRLITYRLKLADNLVVLGLARI